jgi:hypothetical protein
MPVPYPMEKSQNVKYEVPFQTKKYFCSHCQNDRNSLRWIEKFSNQGFKCDNCWSHSAV